MEQTQISVLVVEDDPAVASLLNKALQEGGYAVSVASDGHGALDHAARFSYDLFILDIMLPGIGGMEICKTLRARGVQTPVMMLTALGMTNNIVMGLDAGADDYMAKPFKIAELLARVRALLRRNSTELPLPASVNSIKFADLVLNLDEKNARRYNKTIGLTATEFRLLEYFMRNPKKVLSRVDILEAVWGYEPGLQTKVVDVYINYLRKKMEESAEDRLLQTVVGMGYILKEAS